MSPAGARRILHLGGLNSDNGVFRFCENISKVKDWQLLLHGHGFGKEIDQLRHRIDGYYSGYYTNVRLDEEYFERRKTSNAYALKRMSGWRGTTAQCRRILIHARYHQERSLFT